MKVQLKQLIPGSQYKVQVRVTDGDTSSQWSKQFDLTVGGDTIAPKNPSGLSWVAKGTAFEGTWNRPTQSTDGTALKDFKDFQVTLTAGGISVVYYTAADRFDFAFEDNYNAFKSIGAQATVKITVKSRDITGNLSSGVSATASNPAPDAPTGLVLTPINEAIDVSWDASDSDDVAGYKLYQGTTAGFTPNASSLKWTGTTTSTVFTTTAYSTDHYFKVTAFDVFGTESTVLAGGPVRPKSSFVVDTNPPSVPTNLAGSITTEADQHTYLTVTWTKSPEDDVNLYQIRYRPVGASDYANEFADKQQASARIDKLKPYTDYEFAIRAADFTANYSDWSSTVTASGATNTPPSAPTGVNVVATGMSVGVIWDANTELDVAFGAGQYEVQVDTANTFNTSNLQTVKTSALTYVFDNMTPLTTYYARVRAIDSLGLAGAWSAVVMGTPFGINGSVIIANTIAGNKITTNTLDAAKLKANSAIVGDLGIQSTLTIGSSNTNGFIQSYGYTPGVSGFKLDKNSIEINSGTISAGALDIQTGTNLVPPMYATFIPSESAYAAGVNLRKSANVTATPDQTIARHANGCSMKIVSTAANQWVCFNGPSAGDNGNIDIEPGKMYIYSAWVYATAQTSVTLQFATTVASPQVMTTTKTCPAGQWTRISGWGIVASNATAAELQVNLSSAATINIDAQQVELKLGSSFDPSPWSPPGITKIDGSIIRTGAIRSTSLIAVNGTNQPAWSINVNGAAQLGDALVRGKLIVGASGDADQSFISSYNYVHGSTGWIIRSDGSAELQNLQVGSGQINDDAIGSISASKITAGNISADVLISGSIETAATGARVALDSTGISVFDSGNNNLLSIASSKSSLLITSPTDASFMELKATSGSARMNFAPPYDSTTAWGPGTFVTNNSDPYMGSGGSSGTTQYPIATVTIKAPKLDSAPDSVAGRALLMLSAQNWPQSDPSYFWRNNMSKAALRANFIALNGSVIREGNFPALFLDDMQSSTDSVSVSGISASLIKASALQWMDMGSMIYLQGFISFNGSGAGTTPIAIGSFPRQFDRTITRQNFAVQIDGILAYDGTGSPYRCSGSGTTLTSGGVQSGLDRIYVPGSSTSAAQVTLVGRQITANTIISFSGFYFTADTRGLIL